MKQRSQMLQSRPMRAPARMLTKAQMRVPSPIAFEATRAVGWMEIMRWGLAYSTRTSEVGGAALAVEVDCACQAFAKAHARLPADEPPDLRNVGDEVAGLLGLAFRRELGELEPRVRNDLAQKLGNLEEGRGAVVADVEDLADGGGGGGRRDEGLDAVVDVEEVAEDLPGPEDGDRAAFERETDEPVHDAELRVAHLAARAVHVGQPK